MGRIKNFSHESAELQLYYLHIKCKSKTSRLRTFKGMFDSVEQTGIKITVCNFWLHVLILSQFESFGPLSVLKLTTHLFCFFVKWVLSGYKSLSLNTNDNNWRRLNVSNGHYLRKFLKDSEITLILYHLWSMIWRV